MVGEQEERGQTPYNWWDGEDLGEMWDTVEEHGLKNVRIEVYTEHGKGGKEAYIRVVLKSTGEVVGHYDFSHGCPTDCN
ncbi:MAG: hypothetical protein V3T23_13830 [Nitrososphaerales archaeon]